MAMMQGLAPTWMRQQSPYPDMQTPGQPVMDQQQPQEQQQAPQNPWDRTAFRDAWMSSGVQNVPDMQNWLQTSGWGQHVGAGGSKGDKMYLPGGETIDAVLAAGLGGNRGGPQWTGSGNWQQEGRVPFQGGGAQQGAMGGIGPSQGMMQGQMGGWGGGGMNHAMMQNMQNRMWQSRQQNRMQHRPGGMGPFRMPQRQPNQASTPWINQYNKPQPQKPLMQQPGMPQGMQPRMQQQQPRMQQQQPRMQQPMY